MELLDYTGLSEHKIKYDEQLSGIVADIYDSTSTYSVGEYVIHYENNDNKLYRCIADITEAEDWTESHWTQVDVTDEIDKTDHNVDLITNDEETYGPSSIVTFESESDRVPIRKITSDFSPVQDLHGYDYPWPAGCGSNLLYIEDQEITKYNEITLDKPISVIDGIYTLSLETTTTDTDTGMTSIFFIGESGYSYSYSNLSATGERISSQTTMNRGNDTLIKVRLYASSGGVSQGEGDVATFSKMKLEAGSVATPYSNICPIEGWTECEITNTGKNLCLITETSIIKPSWYVGGWSGTSLHGENGITQARSYVNSGAGGFTIAGLPSGNYVISFDAGDSTSQIKCGVYYSAYGIDYNQIISPFSDTIVLGNRRYIVFSVPDNKEVAFRPTKYKFDEGETSINFDNIQLEIGSAVTAYEPYKGQTLPISWQTEVGTVYGGTLTLNEDGSADVVATMRKVVFNSKPLIAYQAYIMENSARCYFNMSPYSRDNSKPDLCSVATKGNPIPDSVVPTYAQDGVNLTQFRFPNSITGITENDTEEEARDKFAVYFSENPIEYCYTLATPQTYHIDNIYQLTTLLGTNNVWTTMNGDTTVTVGKYISTITSHIDGTKSAILALIAKDESSGVASTNYVANQFITMNGKFYRITTNVASGATFVIGTNCVETTVGSQITALLNA